MTDFGPRRIPAADGMRLLNSVSFPSGHPKPGVDPRRARGSGARERRVIEVDAAVAGLSWTGDGPDGFRTLRGVG